MLLFSGRSLFGGGRKILRKSSVALLFGLLVLLAATPAFATTVLKVEVPEMTRTSEWVVRAHVMSVTPVDLRSEGKTFHTDVEFLIEDVFKGEDVPSRYVMRQIGGHGADGMRMWIPGMPVFQRGEEVVLFLEKTSAGHIPCGLGQGVWRVRRDAKDRPWVAQSTDGVHLMERAPTGKLRETHPPLMTRVRSMSDLAMEIQQAQKKAPAPTPKP